MSNRGFLVPSWYVSESPNEVNMNMCSMIWGFSLCSAVFTAAKASRQTWVAHKRGKLFTAYPIMVWAEWTSSVIISVISWMFLKGITPPSFWLFLAILCLWTIQMHCILQIIINRVSLVVVDKARAKHLRLVVFLIVTMINISVFCIWIPARLQINDTYVRINDVWDRTEKAIFAVVDASLNCYFIYNVRTSLIASGLDKYRPLFRFNLLIICVSMALDVILIGSMSMGTGIIYIQFHPLVYLIKLHIELNMAELISKVVRASNPINTAGNTVYGRESIAKENTPTHTSDSNRTHRDSGIASMDMGRDIDMSEQGLRRSSGLDYHEALRSPVSARRTSDLPLDGISDDDEDDDDYYGHAREATSQGELPKRN